MESWKLAFLLGLGCQVPMAAAQVRAFEGAEGFGAFATGARTNLGSASVYHVTNLNDSGPGSFRDAVSASNRFVVFDVGGIINIGSTVVVKNNVTIAGQTAPGGVAVFGAKVSYSGASNAVSRYMAYRLGRAQGRDDASGASNGANMMFDHMSITWGVDETLSFNSDGKGTLLDNITVQNSIIGQGLDVVGHSAGGLMTFPEGSKFSLIRNLFTDSVTRNPKVRGENEFINNVVYGWETAAYIMGDTTSMDSHANAIGNYFIEGPVDGGSPFTSGSPNFHIYASDNFVDTNRNGVLDGTLVTNYPGADRVSTPFAFPTQNAMTAQDALAYVLQHVGPSVVRDAVDQRLVDEVASYGTFGGVILRETDLFPGYGTDAKYLNPRARLVDTDNDGMPDNWEVANGLNPNLNATSESRALNADGRTRLEAYLNELGADGETILSTGGNWANGSTWNGAAPTLADSAIVVGNLSVTSGNAFARRLAVGGNLSVTGGTLDVFDTATIDGTLSIAGGTATFGRVLLGSPGTTASLTLSAGSTIQTGPIAGNGGTATLTFDGGTFRALGAPNIGVATVVAAGGGTINTNGYSGTISGGLSGNGTLTKSGLGTLTLAGNNSAYSGGINLNAGAITLAPAASSQGSTGTITAANGTQINVSTSNVTTPLALANGATVTLAAGGLTYGGAISGAAGTTLTLSTTASGNSNFSIGGLLTNFAGTIDLAASTGNVRINQGGSALANFDAGDSTGTIRVANDGTTHFGSLSGGANTRLTGSTNGTGNTTFAIGANGSSTTFAGTIGNGTNATPSVVHLTKTGAGTLALTNAASTYTGVTRVSGGTLSASVLANGGLASSIGASTSDASNLVLDGGTLRYTGGAATTDRGFTLAANGGAIERNGGGNLTLGNAADVAMAGTGDRTLTLRGDATSFNNFHAGLTDPTVGKTSLTKSGAGTWRLFGSAKTYSGDTTVDGGTLYLASAGVLPTGAGKGDVNVNAGTLELFGSSHTINGLNGAGTVTTTINTARTLTVGNGDANGAFAGTLTQGASQTLALTKVGAGTQVLSGANTYTGTTTVDGGNLTLGAAAHAPVLAGPSGADIRAGRVVFDYAGGTDPTATIAAQLKASFATGFAAGQLRSSTATPVMGLGYRNDPAAQAVAVAATRYGDTDLDFDVDTGDVTTTLSNFTGAGTGAGAQRAWALGNTDYDDDTDTGDVTTTLSNFTGAQQAAARVAYLGAPLVADLIYDAATGGVSIDADGFNVLSFVLNSNSGFLTNFTQDQLNDDTFNLTGLQDNTASVIGWVSGVATAGVGYTGTVHDPAFIGNILPAGLTLAQLDALLTRNDYAGPAGTGGAFELFVVNVPEPTTLAALGLAGAAFGRRRRRRC